MNQTKKKIIVGIAENEGTDIMTPKNIKEEEEMINMKKKASETGITTPGVLR